ncbi:disulfide bond formation protein B, partial [bacterium]|nr:disulfide bond formation protein B [bacterium]
MNTLFSLLFASPARALSLLALGAASVLSAAFFFQYVLGYQPCILCIYQRWPYAAVIVFALAALALGRRWTWGGEDALLVACGFALLACSGIAFYHVGVE